MKKIICVLILLSFGSLTAQSTSQIQEEINQKVWKSFKKAFETLNAEDLNHLYADEVLRVTPEGIDTKNRFKNQNIERFNVSKANGSKISLDFWFDSRHTNEDTSYEVGFYRIKFLTNEQESIVYGQFHIVLKKIKGKWKITQDWDTTMINKEEITAKHFAKNTPIRF